MKIALLAAALLTLAGTPRAVLAQPPDTAERADRLSPDILRPKPKYASCQKLIDAVQKDIFSQYVFQPTAQLTAAGDSECTTNPLFMFAGRIAKRADDLARAAALRRTNDTATSARAHPDSDVRADVGLLDASVSNLDVISRMVRAADEKQYGTFVRELGLVNGALACSSRNSTRVLDLLLAEILAASMDGGLDDPAEQDKCVQGVFNAGLNTFDQLQYTGFSLVQSVLTRDNAKARALLYPSYPVCPLGIWVYDFITGKLVQLRDPKACEAPAPGTLRALPGSQKEQQRRYRYLLGYLDQFADPKRFGTGQCSEYYVSGKKDFTCDVGLVCKNTAVNPDLRNVIEGASNAANRDTAAIPGKPSDFIVAGKGKPTRFGIPVGVADEFLCGRGLGAEGGYDSHARGAFGQPGLDMPGSPDDLSKTGRGAASNAAREFFQCQASTLFETKQDPMTSCILSAMNDVMREEKRQSMPDGGRGPTDPSFVIGGVKDPSCKNSDPDSENKDKALRLAKDAEANNKAIDSSKLPARERTFFNAVVAGVGRLLTDTMVLKGYSENDVRAALDSSVVMLQYKFINDLKETTGLDYVIDGSTIYYDRNMARSRDMHSETRIVQSSLVESVASQLPLRRTDAPFTPGGLQTSTGHRDPGIDQALNSACTSALDRALDALAQCNTPDMRTQPRSDGHPQGGSGYHGVNPLVVDPDPQGVSAVPLGSIMAGLLACVDQYGKAVSAASGSQYGPGGCISPMTLCNTNDCTAYKSNCAQGDLWQCSFALCREDTSCCGSPHTSRGGGGDTASGRTGNSINCGDRVWNAAKRKCDDINLCGEGMGIDSTGMFCDVLPAVPHVGPGPGPETGGDGDTIPDGSRDLEPCPPGTRRVPGSTHCSF